MTDFISILAKMAEGKTLPVKEAEAAFDIIMRGEADTSQMAAFLTALRVRGETVDEIIGGTQIMRRHADTIKAPPNAIDIVGTGGSGLSTYNVSTAACFIVAAAGIPVAKHGNRAASSKSGSADVLEALGGSLDIGMQKVQQALDTTGFTFLFARAHHKAMRHVAPVRASLKFKTIFNLLGPLSSPARAEYQLLGVFDKKWLLPLAEVLKELGSKHVMIVHGSDGMDEITTSGLTHVAELKDGIINQYTISPADAGLETVALEQLLGGDATFNAQAIHSVMNGEKSPLRDIVLMNAGAALKIAGKATTLKQAVSYAAEILDTGKARETMNNWIMFTKECEKKA
ncbi:anthranilate phosphoribosyltransferase [Kordiimonas pumila]|uniref:Anthranilate phosphoribosyltransferase n=1 Tax=Kordiimonas pumila TaxID=2161677 RepID=A0ABV7D2I5_9PROT|nr:anthranilate phosphoribosyltransferase [Kordiimonas pumila]